MNSLMMPPLNSEPFTWTYATVKVAEMLNLTIMQRTVARGERLGSWTIQMRIKKQTASASRIPAWVQRRPSLSATQTPISEPGPVLHSFEITLSCYITVQRRKPNLPSTIPRRNRLRNVFPAMLPMLIMSWQQMKADDVKTTQMQMVLTLMMQVLNKEMQPQLFSLVWFKTQVH